MDSDYTAEKWVELYHSALLELTQSLIAGRIMDARAEILNRTEQLQNMRGLHVQERQAIQDALTSLRYLENEEARYIENQQRAAAQDALKKLDSIAPAIARLKSGTGNGS